MRSTGPAVEPDVRPATRRRRPRWPWVVAALVVVVVIALIVGFTVTLPYYSLSPGTAMSVSPLITFPPGKNHPSKGAVLLTDVSLSQVRLIDLLPDWLDSNVSLVKSQDLLGGTPPAQFEQQSVLQMSDSKTNAEVAALRRLGYSVPETDSGALVLAVLPGSPASGKLSVGDVITAVDGRPVSSSDALVAAVRSKQPGEVVHLSVKPGGTGSAKDVVLALGAKKVGNSEIPFVGIELETKASYDMPLNIQVNSEGIGGPSAGLAFTLGIMDGLTPGDMTGGKKVAATGTMDAAGKVGDVGGVAQKTVAVSDAGASLFLVPPQEKHVADEHAGSHLKVVAVSTLDQALAALRAAGGNMQGVPPVSPLASAAA